MLNLKIYACIPRSIICRYIDGLMILLCGEEYQCEVV